MARKHMKRKKNETTNLGYLMIGLTFIGLLAIQSFLGVSKILFKRDCTGHLKRAADANTVILAYEEMTLALTYIEKGGYTKGYTSIVYNTPDEDINFWYRNLLAAQTELKLVSDDTASTSLERSNVLMKLRETLMDKVGDHDSITYPPGLAWYPNNTPLAMGNTILLFFFAFGLLLTYKDD